MIYVKMRHSGISHDIKTIMEIIPCIGHIIDFSDGEDHHLFKVDRIVHIYEDHKLVSVDISGRQMTDWLG